MEQWNFDREFKWGVATSALQTEGAYNIDGKSYNIWDEFVKNKKRIKNRDHHFKACDFYNRFREDLLIVKLLNLNSFRFSLSWSRILPKGNRLINHKGLDFYKQITDFCLELGIEPFVTLYHWDLPQWVEDKGGWVNRDVVGYMNDFAEVAVQHLGDRVKHWMPLNEPLVFTTAGYFLGLHAPGKKGLKHYLPALYNAIRCNAETSECIKGIDANLRVGSTFSLTPVTPHSERSKDRKAAKKLNTILNHLFLDPYMGKGLPIEHIPILRSIEKYRNANDTLHFDADFIGIQNYTREVVKHSWLKPLLMADAVPASKRQVPVSQMNWEIIPDSIQMVFEQLKQYDNLPEVFITECGIALENNIRTAKKVYDLSRTDYFKKIFRHTSNAIRDGLPIKGLFIWTLLDNFEWAEGYHPKFGIVEVDRLTMNRSLKYSAQWLRDFLDDLNQGRASTLTELSSS